MKKVKVFSDTSSYNLEKEMNEWLEQHQNILIISSNIATSISASSRVLCAAMITYEEGK